MAIQTIGVIGAGQMGNGIAHVMAVAEYDVLLTDVSQQALDKALETIRGNLSRQVSRGKLEESVMEASLSRKRKFPLQCTGGFTGDLCE